MSTNPNTGLFQPRTRAGSKLTTVLDSEGREVEAESREDEEQNVKLNETIDLLLAAGYFRARIKGLSPFDKVVGGMTWCITTCNFDVDVDLLFQENSTIGQKISLTEKIVGVLPRMKCPYRIEPHQIQGMDFIHIYPVVQWLVKRAIETREEMGDLNRVFSVSQFNKYNQLPEDESFAASKRTSINQLTAIKTIYGPRRKYRRLHALTEQDEETRVQSSLLEFGRRHGISKNGETTEGKKKGEQVEAVTPQDTEQEEKRIAALMGSMTTADSQQNRLSSSVVGSMVVMQSDEIRKASEEYAQKQAKLEQAADRPGTAQHHRRVLASLNKQLGESRQRQEKAEEEYRTKKEEALQLKSQLDELEAMDAQIQDEMTKLESLETQENQSILEKLRKLVAVNDSIKEKEKEYKQKCREELSSLQSELAELERTSGVDEDEEERNSLIEKQYENDKAKLHKLKLSLAKRNREIASLQRRIDEVPSRSELSQYQRRFVELYNQVSATHKQTKQFYTLYNTLDQSKFYLEKEISFLNSIYDNFKTGMSSPENKDQFLKQFERIVDGIKASRAKMDKQKEAEKMKRDQLDDDYRELLEQQRLYFKTVKEFKEECRKNEILLSKLNE